MVRLLLPETCTMPRKFADISPRSQAAHLNQWEYQFLLLWYFVHISSPFRWIKLDNSWTNNSRLRCHMIRLWIWCEPHLTINTTTIYPVHIHTAMCICSNQSRNFESTCEPIVWSTQVGLRSYSGISEDDVESKFSGETYGSGDMDGEGSAVYNSTDPEYRDLTRSESCVWRSRMKRWV